MSNIPFFSLGAGTHKIRAEVEGAIARVIVGTAFATGSEVERFEEKFAAYYFLREQGSSRQSTDGRLRSSTSSERRP